MVNKATLFHVCCLFFFLINSRSEASKSNQSQISSSVEVVKSRCILPSVNGNCPISVDTELDSLRSPTAQYFNVKGIVPINKTESSKNWEISRSANKSESAELAKDKYVINRRHGNVRSFSGLIWWIIKAGIRWGISSVGCWMFGPWFSYAYFAFNVIRFVIKFMVGCGFGFGFGPVTA